MTAHTIEIFGGPFDGQTIDVPIVDAHPLGGPPPWDGYVGVPIHERPDGTLYVEWADVEGRRR